MKQILILGMFCGFLAAATPTEKWTFHCEAEKGEKTASVPRTPGSLELYTHAVPRYSSDPLEADAVILKSSVKDLGKLGSHSIKEVRLELKEGYYTDFFLLLCEMKPGLYLPIYAQQYNRGVRSPEPVKFTSDDRQCRITVEMLYSGTEASRSIDELTLTKGDGQELQLTCKNKE